MAHEIHASDRFGEVRKNGQRAWHGLGQEIEEGMTAVEAFEEIGLNWRTIKAPVVAKIEGMGPDGPTVTELPLRGSNPPMAHIRTDTNRLLGMVSDSYQPLENIELARFADALAGADAAAQVETAGSLYHGRRVFALVRLPQVIRATKDDVVVPYTCIQNGHGGTAAFSAYNTGTRVVCANTLRMSERDILSGIRFQHTGDLETKVKQAQTVLNLAIGQQERFQEQVTAMVGKKFTAQEIDQLLHRIADDCFGPLPTEGQVSAEVREREIAKRTALIEAWQQNLANERQNLPGIQGSAWAVLNAVTEWNDHDRGTYQPVTESDARIASNTFGASARTKSRAFKTVLATV